MELTDILVKSYSYKKLPSKLSEICRDYYKNSLPKNLNVNGDNIDIYTKDGTLIASGYDRIVIGDYGAFLEIPLIKFYKNSSKCKTGQEYRIKNEDFRKRVKYFWLTAVDKSDIKIYFQQKTVVYADYKPKFIYICPFEVKTELTKIVAYKKSNPFDEFFCEITSELDRNVKENENPQNFFKNYLYYTGKEDKVLIRFPGATVGHIVVKDFIINDITIYKDYEHNYKKDMFKKTKKFIGKGIVFE